jgi:two-component system NtrC family sensor kinase
MGTGEHTPQSPSSATDKDRPRGPYSRLYRKFIWTTLICSLVPLLLVGWGIHIHYAGFARDKMLSAFSERVDHHRKVIELFLEERRARLQLIAETHSVDSLRNGSKLDSLFRILNQGEDSYTDLGVIDERGRHLAYIGPYDLIDKNYSQTFWFKQVMDRGIYISDMFLGFRKVPHFIIAVSRSEGGTKWILRATINTEAFRALVENVKFGRTGEVFLVNEQGIYQTSPRFTGEIMEEAPFPVDAPSGETRIRQWKAQEEDTPHGSAHQILAETWLEEPRWMLIVRQEYAEALAEVNHANWATLVFLHLSALTLLCASFVTTRYMVNLIKNRDRETEQLNRQLQQAGKMASVGELSAGVAHEINNPLAIILTERQILLDSLAQTQSLDGEFKAQLLDSLSQIDTQVHRCKRLTQNLLRFSRRTKSVVEAVSINAFLKEVVELMEREAGSNGIRFQTNMEENLPSILSDPSQLQQVFLNLVTNAVDAHDGKPYGRIRISTRSQDDAGVEVVIADTGCGIRPEHLDKIFDPFFTTKPVGKGTGLGLSICYAIVRRLGGTIAVESEPDTQTTFTLFLPFKPPPDLEGRWVEQEKQTGGIPDERINHTAGG